jgi:hypothetical protein
MKVKIDEQKRSSSRTGRRRGSNSEESEEAKKRRERALTGHAFLQQPRWWRRRAIGSPKRGFLGRSIGRLPSGMTEARSDGKAILKIPSLGLPHLMLSIEFMGQLEKVYW